MSRRRQQRKPPSNCRADVRNPLVRRAIRHCRRGDYRKASVVLRELVAHHPTAAHWTKLGVRLLQARRHEAALDALAQGIWLHRRSGFPTRADALRPRLERARTGGASTRPR